jgi:serine protease inhibitor
MKLNKLIIVLLLVVLVTGFFLILSSCNGDSSADDVQDNSGSSAFLASSETRNLNPEYTEDDLDLFVADNNAFALDLYHEISDEGENLFSLLTVFRLHWL